MSKMNNMFIDENHYVHIKDKILGQGGQGVVFRTRDPDIAIKLVTDESGKPVTDKDKINHYAKRLKNLQRIPIPENINLSIPIALLKDKVGYVMQLLNDMTPFSDFWINGKFSESIKSEDVPKWLSEMPEEQAKKIIHYYQTGGLRRRLMALYKCSALIARLHGTGLVYGDISPANVYISEDLNLSEVWLIDADNLRFERLNGGSSVYTPMYGAPELVQEIGTGRPRTDCHAFAVMAFYMLSMNHPFIGDLVDGETDGDWAEIDINDDDLEEQAYAGKIPWIDDNTDDSNSSSGGLPRQLLLTKKLERLFQKTFGTGRTEHWKRPSIYHWTEALAEAADQTILCVNCNMTWYFDIAGNNCPYCESEKPIMLICKSYHWNNIKELGSPCWEAAYEISNRTKQTILPQRLFLPSSLIEGDQNTVVIMVEDNKIFIKKAEQSDLDIYISIVGEESEQFIVLSHRQKQLPMSVYDTGLWFSVSGKEPRLVNCYFQGGNQ